MPGRRPANAPARSGMALVLALAAIALAGGLAFWMQARSLGALREADRAVALERLRAASAEAVRLAMRTLQEDANYAVDFPGDAWAEPREWTTDDGIAVRTVTEDAARWFDWNNLAVTNPLSRPPRAVLPDLMAVCGRMDADAAVDALADYTDADAEGVYEAAFYRLADRPFSPPDRPLWAPDELLDIHAFPPELFLPRADARRGAGWTGGDLSASCALVPAAAGLLPVNLNTASRAVLLGVFGPEREPAVRALLALREMQPLESAAMLAAVDPAAAGELESWTAVGSPYFRITARAVLPYASASVTAWVEREGSGRIRILQWIESGAGA